MFTILRSLLLPMMHSKGTHAVKFCTVIFYLVVIARTQLLNITQLHREQFTRLIQYCCICESTQVRTCKLIPFITYCRSDPLVQKYAGEDDVCQSLYPRSFEGVVPRSVLKALRYYRYGAVKHNNHQKLLFTAASQVSGRFNVVHRN